jgi:hypothetical protein
LQGRGDRGSPACRVSGSQTRSLFAAGCRLRRSRRLSSERRPLSRRLTRGRLAPLFASFAPALSEGLAFSATSAPWSSSSSRIHEEMLLRTAPSGNSRRSETLPACSLFVRSTYADLGAACGTTPQMAELALPLLLCLGDPAPARPAPRLQLARAPELTADVLGHGLAAGAKERPHCSAALTDTPRLSDSDCPLRREYSSRPSCSPACQAPAAARRPPASVNTSHQGE